jgi:hypothetical protein
MVGPPVQRRSKVAVCVCCELVKGQHHASLVNEMLDPFRQPRVTTAGSAVNQLAYRDGRDELTLWGVTASRLMR